MIALLFALSAQATPDDAQEQARLAAVSDDGTQVLIAITELDELTRVEVYDVGQSTVFEPSARFAPSRALAPGWPEPPGIADPQRRFLFRVGVDAAALVPTVQLFLRGPDGEQLVGQHVLDRPPRWSHLSRCPVSGVGVALASQQFSTASVLDTHWQQDVLIVTGSAPVGCSNYLASAAFTALVPLPPDAPVFTDAEYARALNDVGMDLYRAQDIPGVRSQLSRWFDAAVEVDPTYEQGLYNAASVAASRGRTAGAVELLEALNTLGTPIAMKKLAKARKDPDFEPIRNDPSFQAVMNE